MCPPPPQHSAEESLPDLSGPLVGFIWTSFPVKPWTPHCNTTDPRMLQRKQRKAPSCSTLNLTAPPQWCPLPQLSQSIFRPWAQEKQPDHTALLRKATNHGAPGPEPLTASKHGPRPSCRSAPPSGPTKVWPTCSPMPHAPKVGPASISTPRDGQAPDTSHPSADLVSQTGRHSCCYMAAALPSGSSRTGGRLLLCPSPLDSLLSPLGAADSTPRHQVGLSEALSCARPLPTTGNSCCWLALPLCLLPGLRNLPFLAFRLRCGAEPQAPHHPCGPPPRSSTPGGQLLPDGTRGG